MKSLLTVALAASLLSTQAMASYCDSSEPAGVECAFYSMTGTVVSTTLITTVVLLKEEVQHVEQDALNFLAGDSMTLALAEIIEKARSKEPGLNKLSDEEVTALLLQ